MILKALTQFIRDHMSVLPDRFEIEEWSHAGFSCVKIICNNSYYMQVQISTNNEVVIWHRPKILYSVDWPGDVKLVFPLSDPSLLPNIAKLMEEIPEMREAEPFNHTGP